MIRLVLFLAFIVTVPMAISYAQSPDEQQACQNDAFRLCQQLIPDRPKVFECLVQNRELLSHICHQAIDRVAPPTPPVATPKAKAKKKTAQKKKGPVDISPPR